MRHAIFFAVARDAKIEIRIALLGGATDRAPMKRFSGAARVGFKTFAPCRDVAPMSRLMNNLRSEKNEIVDERSDEPCAIRIRSQKKTEHQKRSVNPCQPFDFYRQNKKDVNDFLGIKAHERKEQ